MLLFDGSEVSLQNSQHVLVRLIVCRGELAHSHMIGALIEKTLLYIGAVEFGRGIRNHLLSVSSEIHVKL